MVEVGRIVVRRTGCQEGELVERPVATPFRREGEAFVRGSGRLVGLRGVKLVADFFREQLTISLLEKKERTQ